MLGNSDLIAFVPTQDPQRARAFYVETLGLQFVSEDSFAVVLNANGVMVRIANVSSAPNYTPHPFTILGWHVPSAENAVRELAGKGIQFERFPGLSQNSLGIWHSPAGAHVAWFKDPDGNMLSITEFKA